MRRLLAVFALVLTPVLANAQQNLTVRDVLELTKAGLGEEALLALIEVNRPVFPVDVDTLKTLKAGGVPPNVITAMIRSGRTISPEPLSSAEPLTVESTWQPDPLAAAVSQAAPAPQVVVIEHREEPVVREVPVAYPVYVTFPTRRTHRNIDHQGRAPVKTVAPVYWGWNGKLRPDAWTSVSDIQKDARLPLVPQRK